MASQNPDDRKTDDIYADLGTLLSKALDGHHIWCAMIDLRYPTKPTDVPQSWAHIEFDDPVLEKSVQLCRESYTFGYESQIYAIIHDVKVTSKDGPDPRREAIYTRLFQPAVKVIIAMFRVLGDFDVVERMKKVPKSEEIRKGHDFEFTQVLLEKHAREDQLGLGANSNSNSNAPLVPQAVPPQADLAPAFATIELHIKCSKFLLWLWHRSGAMALIKLCHGYNNCIVPIRELWQRMEIVATMSLFWLRIEKEHFRHLDVLHRELMQRRRASHDLDALQKHISALDMETHRWWPLEDHIRGTPALLNNLLQARHNLYDIDTAITAFTRAHTDLLPNSDDDSAANSAAILEKLMWMTHNHEKAKESFEIVAAQHDAVQSSGSQRREILYHHTRLPAPTSAETLDGYFNRVYRSRSDGRA